MLGEAEEGLAREQRGREQLQLEAAMTKQQMVELCFELHAAQQAQGPRLPSPFTITLTTHPHHSSSPLTTHHSPLNPHPYPLPSPSPLILTTHHSTFTFTLNLYHHPLPSPLTTHHSPLTTQPSPWAGVPEAARRATLLRATLPSGLCRAGRVSRGGPSPPPHAAIPRTSPTPSPTPHLLPQPPPTPPTPTQPQLSRPPSPPTPTLPRGCLRRRTR